MANEIKILEVNPPSYKFLFLIPFQSPITTYNGTVVVPTPSSGLPERVTTYDMLTQAQRDGLDSGAGAFVVRTLEISDKEITNIHLALRKIRNEYDKAVNLFRDVRQNYSRVGRSLDAEAPTFPMPDLVGLGQSEAKLAIENNLLEPRRIIRVNDSAPLGEVLRQRPAAGAQVVAGDPVDIEVSIGPAA